MPSVPLSVGRRPDPEPESSPLTELLQAGPTRHNCPQISHSRRRPEKCGGRHDSDQTRPTVEDQQRRKASWASNNYGADGLNHRLMKTSCAAAGSRQVNLVHSRRNDPFLTLTEPRGNYLDNLDAEWLMLLEKCLTKGGATKISEDPCFTFWVCS